MTAEQVFVFPTSFAQRRLWFLDQLEKGSSLYNLYRAIRLVGALDIEAMERAFDTIIMRHESLRTHFEIMESEPVQVLANPRPFKLAVCDISDAAGKEDHREARRILAQEARQPFDLSEGPLMRVRLLKLADQEHVLMLTMHHIISDAWSIGIFFRELTALYNAYKNGLESPLEDLEIQYADYAVWQRDWLQGEVLEEQLGYWKQQLAGAPAALELPTDNPRPAIQNHCGADHYLSLSKDLTDRLKSLGQREGVTLFMTLLASFQVLLSRYCAQKDIVIGTPIAGRNQEEIESLIGAFVNTLVLRTGLSGEPTFREALSRVKEVALGAYANQDVPFEKLVDELQPERNMNRQPLFQVMFALQNVPREGTGLDGLAASEFKLEGETAKFDLSLSLVETLQGLGGRFTYSTELFEAATIRRMAGHFETLLKTIVADPDQKVSEMRLLSAAERDQLLIDWNRNAADFPSQACIHQLFEAEVERRPDAIAAVCQDQAISYRELDARANQLAHHLIGLGLRPEVLVGLCLERRLEMLIALLGILKAGGAYLPLDPNYPRERLAFMMEDAAISLLVTQASLAESLPEHYAVEVRVDEEWGAISQQSSEPAASDVSAENLAYVIYTSGSTGQPKGVQVAHRGLCNLAVAQAQSFAVTAQDRVMQFASLSFDASIFEIVMGLCHGAELYLPEAGQWLVGEALLEEIAMRQISNVTLPPTVLMSAGERQLPSLRTLIVAGEACRQELVRRWSAGRRFYNAYGPTEATVWSSVQELAGEDEIGIGRGVANTALYVLDERQQVVPVGVKGELYISGVGLARGYLNGAEQTALRFVPNEYGEGEGERMYRSGDEVRWRAGGELGYVGRKDEQVKVRGYRIELGEVEEALRGVAGVMEAAVIVREEGEGEKRLVGYVEKERGEEIEEREIRRRVSERLPDYMVPGIVVVVEKLPLTANGKVDRKALPEPDQLRPDLLEGYVAPRTRLELYLASKWEETLSIERIGVNDSFFELGGDSIRAAILVNKLQQELGEVLHVVTIFDSPDVARFALYVEEHYPEAISRLLGAGSADEAPAGPTASNEVARIGVNQLAEMRRLIALHSPPVEFRKRATPKNPPAIFILSPPRSGTTLLRVLLGGHPLLFAPPELELLSFTTLRQRKEVFGGRDSFWLEGLIRAVMEINGCDAEQAEKIIDECEARDLSCQEFYALIQKSIDGRILVDKTPSYTVDVEIMNRAEACFENALYIHLLRSPYGMIRSYEKAKVDQIFPRFKHAFSTRECAELLWAIGHENIAQFLSTVPQQRRHVVRFEELVSDPHSVLQSLCSFIGIDFHPEMLEPYREKQKRMTDGIHEVSHMLGDIKFHQHSGIDPTVAESWKTTYSEDFLGEQTWQLAESFGYNRNGFARRGASKAMMAGEPGSSVMAAGDAPQAHFARSLEIDSFVFGHDEISSGQSSLQKTAISRFSHERMKVNDGFPLSFAQERLWFLDQLEPNSPFYNVSFALRMMGQLNLAALEQSLNEICRRHEVLRSRFPNLDGRPVQLISEAQPIMLNLADLRRVPEGERKAAIVRLTNQEAGFPFDLTHGPLLRVSLLRLTDEMHIAQFTMHHIISDGWSMGILFREMGALYESFAKSGGSPLAELAIQYVDFAMWQRAWLKGEVLEQQLNYWKDQLAGLPTVLTLPTDRPRPAVQSYGGAMESFLLDQPTSAGLNAISQAQGVTLFMTLVAGFQVLLARYSGQKALAIGTPVAGRNRPEIEELIGFFINTLVLRGDLSGDPSFAEFLQRTRKVALGAYLNQEIAFEKLVEDLQPKRSLSHHPLFQVMFTLQNVPRETLELGGLSVGGFRQDRANARFDLTLSMMLTSQGLRGTMEYSPDLFDQTTIKRMMSHFERLLGAVVSNTRQSLSSLPLLTEREQEQMLVEWNRTARDYPLERCVHQLFEAQVERTPEAVALIQETHSLSYAELNGRANQMAHYLMSQGVGPEVLVGVYLPRSLEMVVAVLATMKAGGAYVPLDPSYPAQRLSYMVKDSGLRLVVTQAGVGERLCEEDERLAVVEWDTKRWQEYERSNPESGVGAENLAYVIYTSGSTGQPKGVLVAHGGVINLVAAQAERFGVDASSRVLQFASMSFDASVSEMFKTLSSGGLLCIAPPGLILAGDALIEVIEEQQITMATLPPTVVNSLGETELRGLKTLVVAGEACGAELVQRWSRGRKLINAYGPTEGTVCATIGEQRESRGVTIGTAMANTQVYVLDERMRAVPIGVTGELYIGGRGVARGYHNAVEQTAEKFVANPFGSGRLYRTGDLCRYRADGELEYLGRADQQVKVRGYRIELGEIEAALNRHESITEAAVVVQELAAGDKRLVAYVVTESGEPLSLPEIKGYLSGKLPEYMVPSVIMPMAKLPLTANGKLDRQALPRPDHLADQAAAFVAPRTPLEELITTAWCDLLHLEAVSVNANFFDLGGHSLLATRLVSRLRDLFGVELPLRTIFEAPSVEELSRRVEAARNGEVRAVSAIERVSRDQHLPLSFAQRRMWFLDQFQPGSTAYNISTLRRMRGPLSISALEMSFSEMLRRHEALRTLFTVINGEPSQTISSFNAIRLSINDLSGISSIERDVEARRMVDADIHRPFDLAQGPLVRASLLKLDENDHLLLISLHHIISDEWSMGIMFSELSALYNAYVHGVGSPLPELPVQYADYAVWQRDWLQGERLSRQLSYWKDRLAGSPAVLDLPTDRPRPAVQNYLGAVETFTVNKITGEGIKSLSHGEGVTLFMTLLTAFQVLLSRYSGQANIIIGSPIAGRNRAEIERLIGFFVNTLVLRGELSGNPTFTDFLRQIREVALGAYANQEMPFEELVEELQPERSLSHHPLFQVVFQVQNAPRETLMLDGLRLDAFARGTESAKFDLTLTVAETTQGLVGILNYSTDLFDQGSIKRLISHFSTLLDAIVADPHQRIAHLNLLNAAERQQLLGDWNQTAIAFAADRFAHQLFEVQVERTPDATALVYEDCSLTYRELNRSANQLAHHLISVGVKPEVMVGLCLERSIEMVVGLLGVLKAGAAYLPLDPTNPAERLSFMLKDADVPVLLTQESLLDCFGSHWGQTICLDADWQEIAEQRGSNPGLAVDGDQLAYMIYTSGSTGKPKGAMITHAGLANYLNWATAAYEAGAGRGSLLHSSIAFDLTVTSLYPALLSGGVVELVSEASGIEGLAEALQRGGDYSLLKITPAHLQVLNRLLSGAQKRGVVRALVIGGEALPGEALREWQEEAPETRLINEYGPTETVVGSSIYEVRGGERVSGVVRIGRGIGNTQMYVLDERMELTPVGVAGEIYIGGAGVSRGYWKRAEQTAERMVANEYGEGRLYRTGDVGRWNSAGELEYVGRKDEQVKVRGYRIEIGEVEGVLKEMEGVREAAVMVKEDGSGSVRLVAYVGSKEGVEARRMREYLEERLPEYMVPSAYVVMEELPLTVNGKVDRRGLSEMGVGSEEREEDEEKESEGIGEGISAVEEILRGIWEEVLEVEEVKGEENFFKLGGHSLLATIMISRVRDVFEVELPLRSVFEYPTVAALAQRIEAEFAARINQPSLPPISAAREGHLPLSFSQERLWFFDQFETGLVAFNIPVAYRVKGKLNAASIEQGLLETARRHETLRTRIGVRDGQPIQIIDDRPAFTLAVANLCQLKGAARNLLAEQLVKEEVRRPFDIKTGPLMRASLLQLAGDEHVLLLTLHHIISDGWSMGILFGELQTLYATFSDGAPSTLAELRVQYADYAVWQRQWLQGEVLEQQLGYWKQQLAESAAIIELPTDRPRPAVASYRGAGEAFVLSASLSRELKAASQREGVTLFMLLLSGFKALLSRYSGQAEVTVGTLIANRNRAEIEPLIGFFVNTLALRVAVPCTLTFADLLRRVREVSLGAYAHQELPFEKLVDEIQPERSLSHNPLFQVLFSLNNASRKSLTLGDLKLSGFRLEGRNTATFDLGLAMEDSGEVIGGTIQYSTDLFDPSTIRRLISHLQRLLEAACLNPSAAIAALPLLSNLELRQLLGDFNQSAAPFPLHSTFAELFQQQAERSADAIAVRLADDHLTYAQLNARANRLARSLVSRGVAQESLVALLSYRSLDLLTAILAVFKAGGAYLPIDPHWPAERLKQVMAGSRCQLLIVSRELLPLASACLDQVAAPTMQLQLEAALQQAQAEGNLCVASAPNQLAYVIYTSASTGQPKGAMVEQAGMINHLYAKIKDLRLKGSDRLAQNASQSFDISVWQMLAGLLVGGQVEIFDDETAHDPEKLMEEVERRGVSVLEVVPSLLRAMAEAVEGSSKRVGLRQMRWLVITGEALLGSLSQQWQRLYPEVRQVNAYGPTECSDDVTHYEIEGEVGEGAVPIGKAVSNLRVYVLDRRQEAVAIGVKGELYVGGIGVGRGYLGEEEKTAMAFVPDGYGEEGGGRLYRTGDVTKRLGSGEVEFIGRVDQQVKVRGYRIELGEIEEVLSGHERVREAVVLARQAGSGDSRLIAYVVANQQGEQSVQQRQEMAEKQVAQWQLLYDQTYAEARPRDASFNTAGWESSYTGSAIPEAEMSEWRQATVERIRQLGARRILEIGCGSGMLLLQIAPGCERYCGTDLSAVVIEQLRAQLAERADAMPEVELLQRAAHDFEGLAAKSFEAVILNSVAQYFPNLEYLLAVVKGAVEVVAEGGRIFLGDLRNLRLLEVLHWSVQMYQASGRESVEEISRRVQRRLAEEEELVIAPELFEALALEVEQISGVEIKLKRGWHHNELTKYRYDVVLHIGEAQASADGEYERWEWQEMQGLEGLRKQLEDERAEAVYVRGVPNARVLGEVRAVAEVVRGELSEIESVKEMMKRSGEGVEPEAMWELGERLGYETDVRWSGEAGGGSFDVVMVKRGKRVRMGAAGMIEQPKDVKRLGEYANNPLRGLIREELVPELRRYLGERLPEYMVPSALVMLEAMPLNANGKVDRRRLPEPEEVRIEGKAQVLEPRDEEERAVVRIWERILGQEGIGVEENFFELGGHSLLATRVITRVREELGVEIGLRKVFERPTVAGLAEAIREARRGGRVGEVPAIEVVSRAGELELSFAQQRLWFLDQLESGSAVYNLPSAMHFQGKLNIEGFRSSLSEIIHRHESLRTRFGMRGGQPVQIIDEAQSFTLALTDLSTLSDEARQPAAMQLAREESQRPFDLSTGPLMRASLLKLADDEHVLLLTMHHIVSDAWSIGVFIREWTALYRNYAKGTPSTLDELEIQYADYAAWQRNWLNGEVLERQIGYWKQELAAAPAVLKLPADHPRPAIVSHRGAIEPFALGKVLSDRLTALSQREDATLFMTLLAAFKVLLTRYSGQTDIVVGSPVAGRRRRELESLIGFFINTLVLRTNVSGNPTFSDLLKRVREVALGGFENQEVTFERLVEELQPERSRSHQPLFQVEFQLQNAPQETLELEGLTLSNFRHGGETARFDLTLFMKESPQGLGGLVEYSTDLFERTTIRRMLNHFTNLLEGIVLGPQQRVMELSLLTDKESEQILLNWNNTSADYPRGVFVHNMFESQVERTPDAVAVVLEDQSLTYQELNDRANRLAHYLTSLGIGPDALVGICITRSPEMVIGLLGILKAGGVYLPLDPSYPIERLAYMLEDSQVPALLTQESLLDSIPSHWGQTICLDADWPQIAEQRGSNPGLDVDGDQLAYMIYTSGSTGKPKGAMITHAGLANYLNWATAAYEAGAGRGSLLHSSIAFDLTVTSLYPALLSGGVVELVSEASGIEGLAEALQRGGDYSLLKITPAHLQVLNRLLSGAQKRGVARALVIGGEALPGEALREWQEEAPETRLINEYGPTETVVGSSIYEVRGGERVSGVVRIGRGIGNTQIYVLDERMELAPVGVAGEIYIGGAGVGRGYWKRAEQTAERMVANEYGEGRLYRTGDVGRWNSAGELEYEGRKDEQVKVRGYRIELGEVEGVLKEMEGVREAAVMVKEDSSGSARLVAYVAARTPQTLNARELRSFLRQRLPDFMVPSAYVVLDEMPLTVNGKVDRQALPEPDASSEEKQADYAAPQSAIEEMLAAIWADVLKVGQVGIHDNFFESGGHSLLATGLVTRIREVFHVELPLSTVFESPTVAELSQVIEAARQEGSGVEISPIRPTARDVALPLSYAQQRLWFLDQLQPGSSAYNILAVRRLEGSLNRLALEHSFNELCRRHEPLRTTFAFSDEAPVQVIKPAGPFNLAFADLGRLPEEERAGKGQRIAREEAQHAFDLSQGPLVRATVLKLADDDHVLLLNMHHIISDGWSMGLFFQELVTLYNFYNNGNPSPLEEMEIQYADFAVWQREWLQGGVLEQQLDYWKRQLDQAPPILELPTDRSRPAILSNRGGDHYLTIASELTEQLRGLSQKQGVTLFMTLLSAFQVLLSRYSGQQDVLVGTPIAGRNRGEIEHLLGLFINTLIIRTTFSEGLTFNELLQHVRETALGAYANQEMPFEELVEELQPERNLSRQPLFQVMFQMQNTPRETQSFAGIRMKGFGRGAETAKFDLTLTISETEQGLWGTLNYSRDLYDEATIERLGRHYERLLEAAVANPQMAVGRLELLSEAERQQLVVEWNQTGRDYPLASSVQEMFEQQVEQRPDAIAVVCQQEALSYRELNARVNQLAHQLMQKGVGPEVLVGLCVERNLEMLVGLLGILKAGGAYLPLDPSYPIERLAFMLEDAEVGLLLTQQHLRSRLPVTAAMTVICRDDDWQQVAEQSDSNPCATASGDNLAYVIYTSGSTGQPKGVQVTHRALSNLLLSMAEQPGLSADDRLAALTTLSFDIAALELYLPLICGGRLLVVSRQAASDGEALKQLLEEGEATVMQATPAGWRLLMESGWQGSRQMKGLVGGEALSQELAAELAGRVGELWNMYGPTETTIWSSVKRQRGEGQVRLGGGIGNTELYVRSGEGEEVPMGVGGELYIGGEGLARGYRGRAAETAMKFVPSKYGEGEREYRTGDEVKWRGEGEMEYVGRRDEQVKVRGHRIELGEVESVMREQEEVREAVVVVKGEGEAKRLVGYMVAEAGQQIASEEIRRHLRETLPEYMIPAVVMQIERLPLTPNGKVNRRALAALELTRETFGTVCVLPRTPLEKSLAGMWADVLKIEQVGIFDNFFEIGGHSLLAVRLLMRMQKAFEIELTLREFFEEPTVAGQSAIIEQKQLAFVEADKLAQLLLELDELSEDDAKAILSDEFETSH